MESDKTIKHYWLYVLTLNEGKYYIGKTSKKDPYDRIDQHLHKFYSAQWVKKYGFLDVKEVIDVGQLEYQQSEDLELQHTLQYMRKYGYNNVRGGTLNYSGKYVKVGDRFVRDTDWKSALSILFVVGCMTTAFILK